MERTLSLVLDDKGYKSLTLMKAEANIIDEFTTKNFENSGQIREYFEGEITEYLNENRSYLDIIEGTSGRKFRGNIVILEAHEYEHSLQFLKKRVLYKKHMAAFEEMIKDKGTMHRFLELEKIGVNSFGLRKLVSPFVAREIRTCDFKVISRVDFIKKELKRDKKDFYDILRLLSKAYEEQIKIGFKLPKIDDIYKNKKQKSQNSQFVSSSSRTPQEFYRIDGVLYRPDEIPFDLEDLATMETEFIPDGLGYNEEMHR